MSDVALFDPTQLFLELDQATLNNAWLHSQKASTPNSRWQTYLNHLCLMVFSSWMEEEQNQLAKVASPQTNCWELVNGTVMKVGDAKLLLVPSEASDLTEMRVPQEWVDIPDWVADYYLAIQVNLDDGYLRVWGYGTHQQLKTKGTYNSSDRSYSLTEDDLINDINALWVARELCPAEVTQVVVQPLPTISVAQAENLIQRLGDSDLISPRLAIPFTLWASLIQNNAWCTNIVKQRQGLPIRGSVLQWLQTGVANLTQELGWREVEFQPSILGAKGVAAPDREQTIPTSKVALAKQIMIAESSYELKILPLNIEEGIWGFELRSLILGGNIPAGFSLKLLTEELASFEGNEDIATTAVEKLYLEVALESGEGLVWIVEPTPDNYQPEILCF